MQWLGWRSRSRIETRASPELEIERGTVERLQQSSWGWG